MIDTIKDVWFWIAVLSTVGWIITFYSLRSLWKDYQNLLKTAQSLKRIIQAQTKNV